MYCTMQQAKLLIGIGKPVNNVVKDIDKNKYRSIKLYIGSFFSHYKAVCIVSVAKQKKNIELNDSLIHCQLFCCLFFSTSWSSVCVDISLIIHQKKICIYFAQLSHHFLHNIAVGSTSIMKSKTFPRLQTSSINLTRLESINWTVTNWNAWEINYASHVYGKKSKWRVHGKKKPH